MVQITIHTKHSASGHIEGKVAQLLFLNKNARHISMKNAYAMNLKVISPQWTKGEGKPFLPFNLTD
jgi:hypothetical protein